MKLRKHWGKKSISFPKTGCWYSIVGHIFYIFQLIKKYWCCGDVIFLLKGKFLGYLRVCTLIDWLKEEYFRNCMLGRGFGFKAGGVFVSLIVVVGEVFCLVCMHNLVQPQECRRMGIKNINALHWNFSKCLWCHVGENSFPICMIFYLNFQSTSGNVYSLLSACFYIFFFYFI